MGIADVPIFCVIWSRRLWVTRMYLPNLSSILLPREAASQYVDVEPHKRPVDATIKNGIEAVARPPCAIWKPVNISRPSKIGEVAGRPNSPNIANENMRPSHGKPPVVIESTICHRVDHIVSFNYTLICSPGLSYHALA
jgi:hypothetical protein